MDKVLQIAEKYRLPVIEDAAQALGSVYRGKMAGSIGDLGVFSFHGTKTMTTCEGGMLVCKDKVLFDKIKMLADLGRNPKINRFFWPEIIGYKFKMSNLSAALGCAQLERIDELIEKKRQIFYWYTEFY